MNQGDGLKKVLNDTIRDVPVALVGQGQDGRTRRRQCVKYIQLQKIGEEVFSSSRRGIKFKDLIMSGLANNKAHAQNILKRSRSRGFLFTFGDKRPQQYYPISIESEVKKHLLSRNAPINPTGLDLKLEEFRQEVRFQTLIEYVIPMLPDAPLGMHNLHLYCDIPSDYYEDLALTAMSKNQGKRCQQPIGETMVTCVVYPNGTVDIQIACSNKPFRLESLIDVSHLVAFLGEVRAFVCDVLSEPRGRNIPVVLNWVLAECDINKDIVVSDAFQIASLKVQEKIMVRDFECMLRIYFKSQERNTSLRVEAGGIRAGIIVGQLLTGLFGMPKYVQDN